MNIFGRSYWTQSLLLSSTSSLTFNINLYRYRNRNPSSFGLSSPLGSIDRTTGAVKRINDYNDKLFVNHHQRHTISTTCIKSESENCEVTDKTRNCINNHNNDEYDNGGIIKMTKMVDDTKELTDEERQRMREQIAERFGTAFSNIQSTSIDDDRKIRNNVWNSLWDEKVTPWDLGKPTPALTSELQQYYTVLPKQQSSSSEDSDTYTIHALVPGCGSGYDLVAIAHHIDNLIQQHQQSVLLSSSSMKRYDAIIVGLELSHRQLDHAKTAIETILQANNEKPLLHTKIQLAMGDFFEDNQQEIIYTLGKVKEQAESSDKSTETNINTVFPKQYDLIFDYTFFCAISPTLRSSWGKRMNLLLLNDGGRLLTFMFPLVSNIKDHEPLQGPPFPVSLDEYTKCLSISAEEEEDSSLNSIQIDTTTDSPHINQLSIPARADREQICWWIKN